jgi:amylosucrase
MKPPTTFLSPTAAEPVLVTDHRARVVASRMDRRWPEAERRLRAVYGSAIDAVLPAIRQRLFDSVAQRSDALWELDHQREANPEWFQSPRSLGYVCYTDRFAGTLDKMEDHLDYLSELGVTYLHLMPLLKPRAGESDGGYAVASYEEVDPRIGTMDDLEELAGVLHERGISLCIDLVVNHTAKEHDWAQKALAGDVTYRDFYFLFPDRTQPDQYEKTLREVFPAFKPGNFTWLPEHNTWVWTTFNEFQWDLNFSNPLVFDAMLGVILNLANRGVDIVRLDAVAFLWKRLGTNCENQPEVHHLLTALRALLSIAAPSMVLKAEAIVSPEDLVPYVGAGDPERNECELAYHNQLMVMLWSSIATREARLMTNALDRMGKIPDHAAWATYVRCHDDIGWAVTDEDAGSMGWSGFEHRRFLNNFFSGSFEGSFATGALFQENAITGDARISGSAAALCGIEKALAEKDPVALDAALQRLELLYAVVMAYGGTPLLYMGDELAMLNDKNYGADPDHADDNRWLHRPVMNWEQASRRSMPGTVEHRVFHSFAKLAAARAVRPELHGGATTSLHRLADARLFCFSRKHRRHEPFWMVGNFGDDMLTVAEGSLPTWQGRSHHSVLLGNGAERSTSGWVLPPRSYIWLVSE